jgi:ABC-type antimicrobial peptide transport system permease subunit
MLKYLFLILIGIGLILPWQAWAFLSGPIVPCTDNCTLCDFFVMARNIIKFLSELILVLAPVFVVIGGVIILSSAGVPDRVGLGKRIITSAIIGVLIALLAWTVLGTVFNALIGGQGFPWAWNEFHCQ